MLAGQRTDLSIGIIIFFLDERAQGEHGTLGESDCHVTLRDQLFTAEVDDGGR